MRIPSWALYAWTKLWPLIVAALLWLIAWDVFDHELWELWAASTAALGWMVMTYPSGSKPTS